jgi:hypothetical protein
MLASAIDNLGPWSWIILGLVLMGLELLAPGVFLVWFGLAAMLTGVADWAFGLSWQAAALLFAALSVVAVVVGRAVTRDRQEGEGARPALNRRAKASSGACSRSTAPSRPAADACASTTVFGASSGRTRRPAPACAWCASRARRWSWRRFRA